MPGSRTSMKAGNRQPAVRCQAGVLLTTLLLLGGCSGSHALNMTVAGTPNLNSAEGTSGGNAAIVRIYQLSDSTNFRAATLDAFWQADDEALGDELVDSRQLLLYPGALEQFEIELAETTQFIGVAADLRRPVPDQWRVVHVLSDLRGKRIRVEVGRDHVNLSIQ